jgi:hypothetical protein
VGTATTTDSALLMEAGAGVRNTGVAPATESHM